MLQTVDADVKKDMTETVDVDSATTIVCGSSYSSAAVADAAATITGEMTTVCGSFCFSAAVVAAVSSEITAVAASL